eukprot:209321-Chlamydomonas_euryale.AAC.7
MWAASARWGIAPAVRLGGVGALGRERPSDRGRPSSLSQTRSRVASRAAPRRRAGTSARGWCRSARAETNARAEF